MINTLNAIKYMCLGRIILWLCQFFTSLLQPAWTCLHALTYIHHLGTTSHESHLVKKLVCSTTARRKRFSCRTWSKWRPKKSATVHWVRECPRSSKFPSPKVWVPQPAMEDTPRNAATSRAATFTALHHLIWQRLWKTLIRPVTGSDKGE